MWVILGVAGLKRLEKMVSLNSRIIKEYLSNIEIYHHGPLGIRTTQHCLGSLRIWSYSWEEQSKYKADSKGVGLSRMYRGAYCLSSRTWRVSDKNNVFNVHTSDLGNT